MVPDKPGDLPDLERRRDDLYRQLGQVGAAWPPWE
jgi:hypothetical protein